jgi:hypothetical protein
LSPGIDKGMALDFDPQTLSAWRSHQNAASIQGSFIHRLEDPRDPKAIVNAIDAIYLRSMRKMCQA